MANYWTGKHMVDDVDEYQLSWADIGEDLVIARPAGHRELPCELSTTDTLLLARTLTAAGWTISTFIFHGDDGRGANIAREQAYNTILLDDLAAGRPRSRQTRKDYQFLPIRGLHAERAADVTELRCTVTANGSLLTNAVGEVTDIINAAFDGASHISWAEVAWLPGN